MKLAKVLDNLNSFEKNPFLKVIDSLISEEPKPGKELEKLLEQNNKDLKSADSQIIAEVFHHLHVKYRNYILEIVKDTSSQLDIVLDIVTRDGNCIMKGDWFSFLYTNEVTEIKKKVKALNKELASDKPSLDKERVRDYKIYLACLHTAYHNDEENNQQKKVTSDELSILVTLASKLDLSQEEVKLLNYIVIDLNQIETDKLINDLKNMGVILYDKDVDTIYIPDEFILAQRHARGKEVADKFMRRILRQVKTSQLNMICKKHNISKQDTDDSKIKMIIKEGIPLRSILENDIYKPDTTLTEKKNFVNELFSKGLKVGEKPKGSTLEEKVDHIINYFIEIERDEKVGISMDGYEKLISDLKNTLPKPEKAVRNEFELQDTVDVDAKTLLDYNIKPLDVLEIFSEENIKKFCDVQGISTRGDEQLNILESYKDSENLYIENYVNIGTRNYNELKANGIQLKEAEIGLKFEDVTKTIFTKLGLNVDEDLRKKISTSKAKPDIILNLGNSDIIIGECKTVKESGYNKFSSISRQVKSYIEQAEKYDLQVRRVIIVAPDFSEDFINECATHYDIALTLIRAGSLVKILDGFKDSKLKELPVNLLMRDLTPSEDVIIKAINK